MSNIENSLKKTNSDSKASKKHISKINPNELAELCKETTPVEFIIQKIEENCPSDTSLLGILNKALNSNRPPQDKLEITRVILNNADKTSHILTPEEGLGSTRKHPPFNFLNIIAMGDFGIIDEVLRHKLNINFKDQYNRNALFYSVNTKDGLNITKRLIKEGINVDEYDDEGNSPLILALQSNQKKIVQLFLESTPSININQVDRIYHNSPLHYSVNHNNIELVYLILNYNPDLFIKNKEGLTALELSQKNGNKQITYALINYSENKLKKHNKSEDLRDDLIYQNEKKNDFSLVSETVNSEFFGEEKSSIIQLNKGEIDSEYFDQSNIDPDNISEISFQKQHYNNFNHSQNYMMNNNPNINDNNYFMPYQYNQNQVKGKNPQGMYNNNTTENFNQNYPKNKSPQMMNFAINQNNKPVKQFIKVQKFTNYSISIPFNYKGEPSEIMNSNSKRQVSDYLNLKCPIFNIDLSDDLKISNFINTNNIEELQKSHSELSKINKMLDNENKALKEEILKLKEESMNKDNKINILLSENKKKDETIIKNQNDHQAMYEEKNKQTLSLQDKIEKIELELNEFKSKENFKYLNKNEKEINRSVYLDKKFSLVKYDDKYSGRCLQKDLLDFQELIKDQIKKVKILQEELIKFVQDSVNEISPGFEVIVYGSHSTNLCLPWSDLDLVIVPQMNFNSNSIQQFLQKLYFILYDKKWKKNVKFIESAIIPIIKINTIDQYNNMQIDISMQDQKHFGLKCVELVKSFMREYPVLEPLILSLKNILKYANLNDPYTGGLSSYGLILIVVSFLQSQLENKKSISMNDLGMIFLEFLWYYGYIFDHSKYVIYAYPQNDSSSLDKEAINNYFLNVQSLHELIIVDPLNKTNNVAKSTYQYINIKMAFMIAFVVAHEDCECGCHYNKIFDENANYNPDHCILKRIFLAVKRFNSSTQV